MDAARILAEATHNSSEPVVAYRGGLRLVQLVLQQDLPADAPMVRDLRERGVYVITGGLGKIGLALAKRLAETCRARLVLLTRNPFPERDVWPSLRNESGADAVAAKIRALIDIEALGAEVAVYCADVRSEEQLERAFADAESSFGPIAGVFHLAADMTHSSVHCPLTDLTRQDVELGGHAVLDAIEPRPVLAFLSPRSRAFLSVPAIGFNLAWSTHDFIDFSKESVRLHSWRGRDQRGPRNRAVH